MDINNIEQGQKLTTILAHNRTENIGQDVWAQFVVPRYFDSIDFFGTMPCVIQGGRGCGKTMLLRFLSYQSQFSLNRSFENVEKSSLLQHVGVNWRAETAFLRQLNKRGVDEQVWLQAFSHYLVIKVSLEILSAIDHINKIFKIFDSDKLFLNELSDYDEDFSCSFNSLKGAFDKHRRRFEIAASNPNKLSDINFLPLSILKDLINGIKCRVADFDKTNFHLFIDEYENLLPYQQFVVNTQIKHSEPPIIYKIACKRNGMPLRDTLGGEAIQNKDDFIVYDIDLYTMDANYNVFAGEVLLSRISTVEKQALSIKLNDVTKLNERRESFYESEIIDTVSKLFPRKTQADLACDIFERPILFNKLKDMLEQALSVKGEKGYSADDFIFINAKEASVVCVALLNRDSLTPSEVHNELKNYASGSDSKFNNWISNNFVGCYLNIIKRRKQENLLYAGYDTLIALSKGNLRHFLELARTAFSFGYLFNEDGNFTIKCETQALAALKTSEVLFQEIRSFKPYGHILYTFVQRLGDIFAALQSRLPQSEPEINHFSIEGGDSALSQGTKTLLEECEKWGLLYRTIATKTKSTYSIEDYDWVLDPIYAPKFLISYRKKRKIFLTPRDLEGLFSESNDYFESFVSEIHAKQKRSNFKTAISDNSQPGLFD